MQISKIEELDQLINNLSSSDEASQLTHSAARNLEECRDILQGFVMAAKAMGMGDVYGVLRGHLDSDASEDAKKMRKAISLLAAEGVETAEPDLESILEGSPA